MKVLLIVVGFCLICASSQYDPAEITGDWRSIYTAASNVDIISEGGVMRVFFRHIECSAECDKVTLIFFVKSNGECQKYTIEAVKTLNDVYQVKYGGENFFKLKYVTKNVLAIYNDHLDVKDKATRITLLAAKGDTVSEEERQRYENLTEEENIPKENIRNLIENDDCPPA